MLEVSFIHLNNHRKCNKASQCGIFSKMDPCWYATRWQTITDGSCIHTEDSYPAANHLSLHPDHYRCQFHRSILISNAMWYYRIVWHKLIGCLVSLITLPSACGCFALILFYTFDCLIPIELRLFELLLNIIKKRKKVKFINWDMPQHFMCSCIPKKKVNRLFNSEKQVDTDHCFKPLIMGNL